VEFSEFDALVQAARVRHANLNHLDLGEFRLFDEYRASQDDLARLEVALQTRLPAKYREFMRRYGGGQFCFVDLLPVVDPSGRGEDVAAVNRSESWSTGFVAIAPVGTGDYWGFVSRDGVCDDAVSFRFHEDGSLEVAASDFLEFAARFGLTGSA
jgi:hypothetical protein